MTEDKAIVEMAIGADVDRFKNSIICTWKEKFSDAEQKEIATAMVPCLYKFQQIGLSLIKVGSFFDTAAAIYKQHGVKMSTHVALQGFAQEIVEREEMN